MTKLIRRLLTVVLALSAGLVAALPASAAAGPVVVDGIQLRHLPAGLGLATDFAYDFDGVDFGSRVWESTHAGAWRVDLDVTVMRSARLSSGRALHRWFINYEQRPPAEARYAPVSVRGRPGWLCRDEVFWLLRPGLAVSVLLDRARWTRHDVMRIARSARVVSRAERA